MKYDSIARLLAPLLTGIFLSILLSTGMATARAACTVQITVGDPNPTTTVVGRSKRWQLSAAVPEATSEEAASLTFDWSMSLQYRVNSSASWGDIPTGVQCPSPFTVYAGFLDASNRPVATSKGTSTVLYGCAWVEGQWKITVKAAVAVGSYPPFVGSYSTVDVIFTVSGESSVKLIPQSRPASDNSVSISPHVTACLQNDYKTAKWQAVLDNVYATTATVNMITPGYEVSKDGANWGACVENVVNGDPIYVRISTAGVGPALYIARIVSNQNASLTYDGNAYNVQFRYEIVQSPEVWTSNSGTSKDHYIGGVYANCANAISLLSCTGREIGVASCMPVCTHAAYPANAAWLLRGAVGSNAVGYQQSGAGERRQPYWYTTTNPHISVAGKLRLNGSAHVEMPYYVCVNKYRFPSVVGLSTSMNANWVWSLGLSISSAGDCVVSGFRGNCTINGRTTPANQSEVASSYFWPGITTDPNNEIRDTAKPVVPFEGARVSLDAIDYVKAEALISIKQKDYYVTDWVSGTAHASLGDLFITFTSAELVDPTP